MEKLKRILDLSEELKKKSVLLLGPRRTGKSFLIRHQVKADKVFNLLRADHFQLLSNRPSALRESLESHYRLVVIDEIQKLPNLMDEVHDLIETTQTHFLLTGSSARKLRKTHTSLMAGRAKSRQLFSFVTQEIGDFHLEKVLSYGLLPPVFLAEDPAEEISSYVGDYLREEIQAEALTRKIENFSRFLHQAALRNTELINFESVGSDAQVPARTIREYYSILVDTLLGSMLEPLESSQKYKSVSHSKFYFFDVGVPHALLGLGALSATSKNWGPAFEAFVYQELRAYISYFAPKSTINFWRTSQEGKEVDFVINGEMAIEVKSTANVSEKDLRGIVSLQKDRKLKRSIVVCQQRAKSRIDGIEIWPYASFLKELWKKNIF